MVQVGVLHFLRGGKIHNGQAQTCSPYLRTLNMEMAIVMARVCFVAQIPQYYEVEANFKGEQQYAMPGILLDDSLCVVCQNPGTKKCSHYKVVRYWFIPFLLLL
ncbi:hypothetical protein RJT34_32788 [Clitoria ternatea]|uniref:Uncharacterized protein n=1 Tax=Clitoria ternatea TaxID=43366 RepID=A0AAN9EWM7_CLITE